MPIGSSSIVIPDVIPGSKITGIAEQKLLRVFRSLNRLIMVQFR